MEDWLRANFGRLDAVILDFYHAAEHLGDLGRALHPGDEAAREAWLGGWCHRLKHEGGAAVLEELRSLAVAGREAAQDMVARWCGYFENQSHRMDYPSYVAKGWAIGSGPVESACKTVDRPADEGLGDAMGRGRGRLDEPPAGVVQERRPPVGRVLAPLGELTEVTYKSDAYPASTGPLGMFQTLL